MDLNLFSSLSKESDIHNSFSSENKVLMSCNKLEESALLIIQMPDYTCGYPGNLLQNSG